MTRHPHIWCGLLTNACGGFRSLRCIRSSRVRRGVITTVEVNTLDCWATCSGKFQLAAVRAGCARCVTTLHQLQKALHVVSTLCDIARMRPQSQKHQQRKRCHCLWHSLPQQSRDDVCSFWLEPRKYVLRAPLQSEQTGLTGE